MPHEITAGLDWKGRVSFHCDGALYGVCQECADVVLMKMDKILSEAVLVK